MVHIVDDSEELRARLHFNRFSSLSSICANGENSLLTNNKDASGKHNKSFFGSRLVSWLIENRMSKDRMDGVDFGDQLLKAGILRSGKKMYYLSLVFVKVYVQGRHGLF